MRSALALVLALWPLADAAAQSHYGACVDQARDRLEHDWNNPVVGPDRARTSYYADVQQCVRQDAQEHARDAQQDQQRADQQRLDAQRLDRRADQQRLDEQRLDQRTDQQRADQRRLDQQRLDRQRDDQLRNQQRQ
jgi:hypothetical protein